MSGSRQIHMGGAGAIPLTEIEAYCRLHGITDIGSITDLVQVVEAMDSEYLELVNTRD